MSAVFPSKASEPSGYGFTAPGAAGTSSAVSILLRRNSTDFPRDFVGSAEVSTLHSRGMTHLLGNFFSSVPLLVYLQGKKQRWYHFNKKINDL